MSAVSKVKKKIYKWSTMAIEGLLISWGYRSCKVVVREQGLSLRPHWRTDHQSAQVRPWFLKTCRWPQKFRQWNRQFVNIDDLVRQRGQLLQWFVNGSPMVLQWFVNKWWRQQFVNNPESSSILTNWFVNSSSMCKTCSSILTNFLAIDELSGSLTQFCGRQQLLTNHWRTWLRLWTRSSILTNCLFHWRTSVVSHIFWGTTGELSNLGAYQFVNDWEIKWQTLLTTLGDRSMKQTGLLEFLTAASGFQAEMFLHFFCAPWFFDHVAFKFEKKSLIYSTIDVWRRIFADPKHSIMKQTDCSC